MLKAIVATVLVAGCGRSASPAPDCEKFIATFAKLSKCNEPAEYQRKGFADSAESMRAQLDRLDDASAKWLESANAMCKKTEAEAAAEFPDCLK